MRALIGTGLCALALCLQTGCAGFAITHPGGEGNTAPCGVSPGVIVGDVTYPNFISSTTRIDLTTNDFSIVKTVTAEASSTNVLGLFAFGDNGYGKLFDEARAAGADDVMNIKMDTRIQCVLHSVWTKSTTRLTGTAIKWKQK